MPNSRTTITIRLVSRWLCMKLYMDGSAKTRCSEVKLEKVKSSDQNVTPGFKAKPDAHRMYAQDQVVIHTVRM
jgi:hypothetical protein